MHRRRANKSAKVPNVKLRPAGPVSVAAARSSAEQRDKERSYREHGSDKSDDDLDKGDDITSMDSCPRPFKGVVLCTTGLEDKTTLHNQARELGAKYTDAFTNLVTHLVASTTSSAKYTCALERRIPVLEPNWITESYAIWLRGDDVSLSESVKSHLLPPFTSVVLSCSGISSITRRTQINKLLTESGGTYLKDLERPVKVTHLLCSGDDLDTDKIKYAKKFNGRGEAKIIIVWEDWFWDSVNYGGRFPEENYLIEKPRPGTKPLIEKSPSIQSNPPSFASPSSTSDNRHSTPPSNAHVGSRKNANLGEEDEDEVATVNHTATITLKVWESLLKVRGYRNGGDRLVPPSPDAHPSRPVSDQAGDTSSASTPPTGQNDKKKKGTLNDDSILQSFRRANSFVQLPATIPADSSSRVPFIRGSSSRLSPVDPPPSTAGVRPTVKQIFTGLRFVLLGEADSVSVRSAVEGCGGVLVRGDEEGVVDYVVVRLVSGNVHCPSTAAASYRSKFRTECWLEQCLFEEKICLPEQHVAFLPVMIETPLKDAQRVHLSLSGLDTSEACWLRRLVRVLGITLAPNFSRKSTHLLCPSGTGAKALKAQEWGIPVVGMRWVENIVRTGDVPMGRSELSVNVVHGTPGLSNRLMEMEIDQSTSPLTETPLVKGKQREVVVDGAGVQDITNRLENSSKPSSTQQSPTSSVETPSHSQRRSDATRSDSEPSLSVVPQPEDQPPSVLGSKRSFSDGDSAVSSRNVKRTRPQPKTRPRTVIHVGDGEAPQSVASSQSDNESPTLEVDMPSYEDDGQRKERQNLMKMFPPGIQVASRNEVDARVKVKVKRKRTRMPGF